MGAEDHHDRIREIEHRAFDARNLEERYLHPGEAVVIKHMSEDTPLEIGAGTDRFVIHRSVDGAGLAIFHRQDGGVGPNMTVPYDHEVAIGRNLNNPNGEYSDLMSRVHFAVKGIGPESFELRDLRSSHGTVVRPLRVEQAPG